MKFINHHFTRKIGLLNSTPIFQMKNQIFILIIILSVGCTNQGNESDSSETMKPIKVKIKQENGGFKIFRGGEPYTIKGAGLTGDVKSLKAHGANSFRTWSVGNETESGKEVLDKALANDMTVMMCFYVKPERHGMDYDNEEMVAEQFENIKKKVLELKDHPALLMWCIGNELNLNYKNPKVYDAVNEISKWIHEVDPNHPTTTTVASLNPDPKGLADVIRTRASDLDVLSIQVYGDLFALEDLLNKAEWTGPYMVTEWGTIGHWEMEFTEWGAPVEQTSTEKAGTYLKGYKKSIEPFTKQCIGNYVFLWGQKQERTPTWYGLFLETGEETEAVDMMHYIWNDEWPANRTPRLDSMTLDGRNSRQSVYVKPGTDYEASVFVHDYESDSLTYKWVVMRESTATEEGGDEEEIPEQLGIIESAKEPTISITSPTEEGAYRLFAYVFDGNGHAAHANIPFYVKK